MTRNAVIYHHDDMDVGSASAAFLRGFVRHGENTQFYAQTSEPEQFSGFVRHIQSLGAAGTTWPCHRITTPQIGLDGAPGVLMAPHGGSDDLPALAWNRYARGEAAYSICALHDGLSSDRSMDATGNLLNAPLQGWDALVSSSHAARSAVRHVMGTYGDYLAERMGARPVCELSMPVIAPGIECADYTRNAAAMADRANLRQGLGIAADDIALLCSGVLDHRMHAHPAALYLAAEAAARRSGKRVQLIMAGWFAQSAGEQAFREGTRALCPSVKVLFLDGRDDDVQRRIWRAADIFVSMADGVAAKPEQAIAQAMAAGLPVVASDWRGSREMLSDGVHGFCIPTWIPEAGAPMADEDAPYAATLNRATAVDTGACIDAISILCSDDDKRAAMSQAARAHAEANFDWGVIIPAYQDLWAELEARRARALGGAPSASPATPQPLRCPPLAVFAQYPGSRIGEGTQVRLVDGPDTALLDSRISLTMNGVDVVEHDLLHDIMMTLADHDGRSIAELATHFSGTPREDLLGAVAWLAKLYMVRLSGSSHVAHDADNAISPMAAAARETGAAHNTEFDAVLDIMEGRATLDDTRSDECDPDDASQAVLMNHAVQARSVGDVAMAADCLRRVAALNPGDPNVNVEMGEILAAGGQYERAIACFRRALESNSDNLDAHRNLGKALFLSNHEAEGVHSFRRAVRIAPEDGQARYYLGTALRRAGALNEAVQCLQIAVELDSESTDARYHLGLAYKAQERLDDAEQIFNDALLIDPANRFVQAALLSITASRFDADTGDDASGTGRRIALHMAHQGDFAALKPVFEALQGVHQPLFSADAREISDFQPDAVLSVSSQLQALREQVPGAILVQVPSTPLRRGVIGVDADAVCAMGARDQDALLASGLAQRRVWETGLPMIDPVFDGSFGKVKKATQRIRILFAPTCHPEISAAPVINKALVALCAKRPERYDLVIKPHPRSHDRQPAWIDAWRDQARDADNIKLIEDSGADLLAAMAEADLLIADYASAAHLFLAFDKPMILIEPRTMTGDGVSTDARSTGALSDDQCALLRTSAQSLTSSDGLETAIEHALKHASDSAEQRARARAALYEGYADGQSSARLVAALSAMLPGAD